MPPSVLLYLSYHPPTSSQLIMANMSVYVCVIQYVCVYVCDTKDIHQGVSEMWEGLEIETDGQSAWPP